MDTKHDMAERWLGPDPATVGEVLVLRPGGLGQVVKAVPALRHLRGVYPGARISVVAGGSTLELLRACPYVDRCIDERRPSEALVESFDVAISLAAPHPAPDQKLDRSPLIESVQTRARVAYRLPLDAVEHAVHPAWPARLSDVHRMLRLAWLLGGERPDSSFGLWPTLADRNGAAALVDSLDGPIALVHPGASSRRRRWPIERFGPVIDTIAGLGVQPVVIGLSRELPLSRQLRCHTHSDWTDLVGQTGVGVLAGLMERASLFVGNDSGPAVLATAIGLHAVVVAPADSLEQSATADRIAYISGPACAACGEGACEHSQPDARHVAMEPVLGSVALATRQALGRWQGQQIA